MSFRLVAVDHAIDLGTFSEQAIAFLQRHLTATRDGGRRHYVDAAAVTALEEQVDKATARSFQETVRQRLAAMEPTALRALVARELRPLAPELRSEERFAELAGALDRFFEVLPAQHRTTILEAAFERTDHAALAALPTNRRKDFVEDVYRLLPALGSDVSRTIRHNYTQLSLAFLASPTTLFGVGGHIPGFDPGHDPLFTPGQGYEPPREVIGKAVAAAVCDAVLRALLLSSPDDETLKAVLLDGFEVGYRRRLAHFFGDEYRETLRDVLAHHHLIGELDALINRFGPSDLVPVAGAPSHVLQVDVLAGRHLVKRDLRSSDPYCQLVLSDSALGEPQRFTTSVVKNSLEPVWDASWAAATTSTAVLSVEVLDRDRLSNDDPMGHLELEVASLVENTPHERWFLLEGVESGELHLRLNRRPLRPLYADEPSPLDQRADEPPADLGDPSNVVEGEPPHADNPSLDDREAP